MSDVTQSVFYGGEVSETVASRTDIPKRSQSLKKMLNTFPHKHGAMSNRGGTQMLAPASVYSGNVRRIPFVYNNDDSYTIEITDHKMRFMRNGGFVLEGLYDAAGGSGFDEVTVIYATNAIATLAGGIPVAHGLSVGDYVFFRDNVGAGHFKFVATVTSSSQLTLKNHDGSTTNLIDNGGSDTETLDRVYTLATPYLDADIPLLKFKQKANRMTLTHRNYFPMELTRSAHTAWTITRPNFEPTLDRPTGVSAFATSDNDQYYYTFNNIDNRKVEITAITAGNPTIITFEIKTADGSTVDEEGGEENNLHQGRVLCFASGVFGGTHQTNMEGLFNGKNFVIKNRTYTGEDDTIATYTCELYGIAGGAVDTSEFTFTYTSNSMRYGSRRIQYKVSAVNNSGIESFPSIASPIIASDALGDDRPCTLIWTAPVGYTVEDYYVYKEDNELFGFIGTAARPATGSSLYFNDRNIAPELGDNPQEEPMRVPFYTNLEAAGISNTSNVSIHAINHRRSPGDRVIIESDHAQFVDGIYYVRTVTDDDNYIIEDEDGSDIDGSGWSGAHTLGKGFEADFPAACVYFRQRRGFASKFNARQEVDWSATGQQSTFSRQSDAFSYRVDEAEANEIRHLLSGSDMLAFTGGSVILSTSGDSGFSADTVDNIEQMAAGISDLLEPLKMRNSLLYVQDKVSQVFDLAYTFEQNKYLGQDLTLLASHLIDGVTIVSWAYQSLPEPIVWNVLSNGDMIGVLYERDNNIFGWHIHDTTGNFKDVCVQPEGSDESLHLVVERYIDGETRIYHERMWNRKFDDARDCRFLDSHASLDNPIDITAIAEETGDSDGIKLTAAGHDLIDNDLLEVDGCLGSTELNKNKYRAAEVSGADFYLVGKAVTNWTNVTTIMSLAGTIVVFHDGTLDVNAGDCVLFKNTGVTDGSASIDARWFYVIGGTDVQFTLGTFDHALLSAFSWTGLASTTAQMRVGTVIDKANVSAWISGGVVRKAKATLYGLNHLEGETVVALCDGNYVDNNDGADLVVSNGCLAFADDHARIHVGLTYPQRAELLEVDTPDADLNGRVRSVIRANLKLYKTRGLKAGPRADKLLEMKNRTDEGWNENTKLLSGETSIDFEPLESNNGSIVIQQDYPLPFTVQTVGLDLSIGGNE